MSIPGRFPLAVLPTPLSRAERLERALGSPPIYIKRDDLSGFAAAGNKARKLELILFDALRAGADVLVTGGSPSSNHCAAAAGAARVAGLECRLVIYGTEPDEVHTNLALARGSGARVSFTGESDRASVDDALEGLAEGLRARGRVPYVVPRGGATPLGAAAYALAARELAAQLRSLAVEQPSVVVAAGSCGTQSGLVAGNAIGGHGWRIVGASVSRPVAECERRVVDLANAASELLGGPRIGDASVEVVDARGPGYGLPSAAGIEAARLAASTQGLLLDPVFTAKAFAALLDILEDDGSAPVVFVHTGGVAAALWEMGRAGREELTGARS